MHVRRGRLARADARGARARHDGKFPWTYLGKPLEEILDDIDMTLDEFVDGVRPLHQQAAVRVRRATASSCGTRDGKLTKINDDNVDA